MTTECDRIERDLWLLESGELGPDRAAGVEDHLAGCERCRSLRTAGRRALERYDAAATAELDDVTFARLVRRAREEVYSDPADTADRDEDRGSNRSPAWRPALGGAAAAVALIVVGIALGRSTAPRDGQVAALRSEIHELRTTLALASLDQPSASARLRGVAIASEIDRPRGDLVDALVRTLLRDPSSNVRLAAVDALFALPDTVPPEGLLIEALASEPAPPVRIAIIDYLVARRVERSLETLRQLEREAEDPAVRRHAAWAVEALT